MVERDAMNGPAVAYVGLGSNLGDRFGAMRAAVDALLADPRIEIDLDRDLAPLFETTPIGGPGGQRDFLNSVVRVETTLPPHDLLELLLAIEEDLGRERIEHWGSRVIDLDLLLYDDRSIRDARLVLPHPYLAERLFVLEPLMNLAPNLVPPGRTTSIGQLAAIQSLRTAPQAVRYVSGSRWAQQAALTQRAG